MKLQIGENIKSLRKAANITQETLAEMLGVSCQSVSRWELGVCYPDMELLPAIAQIFRCSTDSLLGIDDATEKAKVNRYLERFQAPSTRERSRNASIPPGKELRNFPTITRCSTN